MNRLSVSYYRPVPIRIITLLMFVALGMGGAIASQPLLGSAGIIGITLFLLAAMSPERMSYLILVTSVVSIQYLVEIEVMGMDMQSLYKIGMLFILIPAIARFGIHRKLLIPIIAFLVMLPITYLLSDMHPLLVASAPINAFFGLAVPFVLLIIRWPVKVAEAHIRILCFLALISVAIGILLEVTGAQPVFLKEFTGVLRLQGANIPAHLAFLAFIGFLVSMIEIKRSPHRLTFYYFLMSVNFLILLLTGTRGPLIAAMAMILMFVYDLVKQFLKGKTALLVPLIGFVSVLVGAVYLQLDNLKKRSFERETDSIIDLSGRTEAWTYFIEGVKDSPWFGRGLGSVLVGNDGSLYEGFVVPHNEYIRFYFDGGIVGVILIFLSLLLVFISVHKRLAAEIKPFFYTVVFGFLIYSISDNTLSTVQFILPFCVYLSALYNSSNRMIR